MSYLNDNSLEFQPQLGIIMLYGLFLLLVLSKGKC